MSMNHAKFPKFCCRNVFDLLQQVDSVTVHFQGGFISHAQSPFHLPASFMWSLGNRSLGVTTHGDITELTAYPEWSLSLCQGEFVWGVTSDKELYVTYSTLTF